MNVHLEKTDKHNVQALLIIQNTNVLQVFIVTTYRSSDWVLVDNKSRQRAETVVNKQS